MLSSEKVSGEAEGLWRRKVACIVRAHFRQKKCTMHGRLCVSVVMSHMYLEIETSLREALA